MNLKVIYPGTFDPITNGHVDIITRAATLFPEVIVAIGANSTKKPFLSLENRIKLAKESIQGIKGVSVLGFDGLLVHFIEQQKANIILRGLRAVSDFEYEFQLAGMNRKLNAEIETIFLTPSENCMFISSSMVKEIASLGGNINQFVPLSVEEALKEEFNSKSRL